MPQPVDWFDDSKYFRPFVVNYLVIFQGLLEMISRSINKTIRNELEISPHKKKEDIIDQFPEEVKGIVEHLDIENEDLSPTPLLWSLSFRSSQGRQGISVDHDEMADYIYSEFNDSLYYQLQAAGSLLVHSFEAVRDNYDDPRDPLWNFFYHCRNAGAHGGVFNITNQRRFPAEWGSLQIRQGNHSTNLFVDESGNGLLRPGDPIYLLYDIEDKYL